MAINYGSSKNTQLKVEIPWLVLRRNGQKSIDGLGNTNIGIRWRFRDETKEKRVALSIYPQVEFNNPTSSSVRRGIVDRGTQFLMPLQWQTQVGKFGINGDVGYRLKRGTDEIIYGVVVGRKIKDSFEILGEIHATGPQSILRDSEVVFNIGSRLKLNDHLSLITSTGRSIRRNFDPRFIGYAGFQITF